MSENRFKREEEAIAQDYEDGHTSAKEYEEEIRFLYREYAAAAEESARGAYEAEMERW